MIVRMAVGLFVLAGMACGAFAEEAAQPGLRKWSDASGKFSVQAEFVALEDGKVQLKKADGSAVSVPLERLSEEDQKAAQSFTSKGAVELKYDDGKPAKQWSIPGGGETVQFETPAGHWQLTSVKLHGSRYGMPFPPKEDILIWVCNEQGKQLAELKVPYKLFKKGPATWVTMKVSPTPVPQKFKLCFYFNAEATKGVFVSYDGKATGQSFVGVPEEGFQPYTEGNWMIRALVEPAKGEPKEEKSPFESSGSLR